MASHWSLNDSKCPQVSMTLPSILADLDTAIVWIISICPHIFKYSRERVILVLSCRQPEPAGSLSFYLFIYLSIFFFFTITRSGRLAKIWWSVCILKSYRSLYDSFLRADFWVMQIPLVRIIFIIIIAVIAIIIIIIVIIIYLLRVFHISVSWWSFIVVWVTASFLKSPGLFSVFWPC